MNSRQPFNPPTGDLNARAVRQFLMSSHPMFDRLYALNTRMIDSAYDRIFEWAMLRKSGLVFTGNPRNGKSYACFQILERLSKEVPHIPAVYLSAERSPDERKDRFFLRQLEEFGFPTGRVSNRTSWQRMFCHYLMAQCIERNAHCILVIWDEAQSLTLPEFNYLMEVWNTLRRYGIQLCTVLVGRPELRDFMKLSQGTGHQAVLGRFFVQEFAFQAVKSAEELHFVLRQYDEDLFYPETNRDWPYSRFFAQSNFDSGWRLSDETRSFWDALGMAQGTGPGANGYRMAWVTDAIHYFLCNCLASNRPLPSSKTEWHGAITAVANLSMLG